MHDLIIIGLGPAGINAGIYAARSNLNILVIEKGAPGGKLNTIKEVHNYLGYENIMGPELATNFYKHFKSLKIPMKNDEVLEIIDEGSIKKIVTTNNVYETKAIIVATGRGQKKLKGFEHIQGISYCTLCDANLFKDKIIVFYGSNKEAINEVMYLSDIVKKIYFICEDEQIIVDKDNVEMIYNEKIVEIKEVNNIISKVVLEKQIIETDGMFINLGSGPSTYFCKNLKIVDENGYILTNDKQETAIPGIYACGDSIKKDIYQIINATSEGAIAAINANKYIKNIK